MESDDKLRLIANRDYLVQNIQSDEILDHLVTEQILNDDDIERLNKMDTNRNKVRKILDILPKRGPNAYAALEEALKENQEFIVKTLGETDLVAARKKRDAVRGQKHAVCDKDNPSPSPPVSLFGKGDSSHLPRTCFEAKYR
jgi:hypothetical protein